MALATMAAAAPVAAAQYDASNDREPNNSVAQAQGPVETERLYGGTLLEDDTDSYFIYLARSTSIEVAIGNGVGENGVPAPDACSSDSSEPSRCTVVARFLSQAGREVGQLQEIPFGQTRTARLNAPAAGRWILQVFPFITRGWKRYLLRLGSNPAVQPVPPAAREHLGLLEARLVARRAIRRRFGKGVRRVLLRRCRRGSVTQITCLVFWRSRGLRRSRVIRLREAAGRYQVDLYRR